MTDSNRQILIKVDVVAFEDHDGYWIAQGIQYDIVARAKSVAGIREAFIRQLHANVSVNARLGRDGLDGLPAAPEKFQRLWAEAKERMTPLGSQAQNQIDIRIAEAA
jgi:hypothetical protein